MIPTLTLGLVRGSSRVRSKIQPPKLTLTRGISGAAGLHRELKKEQGGLAVYSPTNKSINRCNLSFLREKLLKRFIDLSVLAAYLECSSITNH